MFQYCYQAVYSQQKVEGAKSTSFRWMLKRKLLVLYLSVYLYLLREILFMHLLELLYIILLN